MKQEKMAKTAKHRAMLDGMGAGTKLDISSGSGIEGAIPVSGKVLQEVRAVFAGLPTETERKHEEFVTIDEGSKMRATLRVEKDGDRGFLNFTGNPQTFLYGSNVYGSPNVEQGMTKSITRCLDWLDAETQSQHLIPGELREVVSGLGIYINNLEVASYTGEIEDKRSLLRMWNYMYRRTDVYDPETGENKSLGDLLHLHWQNPELDFKDSFRLKKTVGGGKNKRLHSQFMAYDKEAQIRDTVNGSLTSEVLPADISNRLRMELSLNKAWFMNHTVGGRKIETLKQLKDYVEKHFQGRWKRFIRTEIQKFVDQACLVSMLRFDGEQVLHAYENGEEFVPGLGHTVSTEVWLAMLEARMERKMTKEVRHSKLRGTKLYRKFIKEAAKLDLSETAAGLALDMRKVRNDDDD